ncbi:unnamed protein product [Ixodes pacificus]
MGSTVLPLFYTVAGWCKLIKRAQLQENVFAFGLYIQDFVSQLKRN